MNKETNRQIFHVAVGIITLFLLAILGRGFMTAAVFFVIIIGTILMNLRIQGARIFFVDWFERLFERADAPLPGWGSAAYALGVLIALTFLSDSAEIAAVIYILAFGDAISTIVGRMGRIKLPYNDKKTVEGSIALFFASLPAYMLIGPLIVPLAMLAALAESLPILEDNLTVPIVCTAALLVL